MEKATAIRLLTEANPHAGLDAVTRYVDAWMDYREAQRNIDEHGAVVAHPRTGAPIENPYVKVRASATTAMAKAKIRHVSALWS